VFISCRFLAPGIHKKRTMLKEKDIKCIIKVGLLPNGYPHANHPSYL